MPSKWTPVFLLALPLVFSIAPNAIAQTGTATKQASWQPDLLIVRDGWKVDRSNVRKVLESAGSELWKHFPDPKIKPIIVYPKGGPIVLFKRGPEGEIVLKLNTERTLWAQYSFQFAHELCHVLCGYDEDPHGHDWFEESICETASLFALRRMGETWKTNPPYANWKDYGKSLTAYAQSRIDESQMPADKSLKTWYAENAEVLKANAIKRELNNIVAVQLLPMFESNPENWGAVAYLNHATPKAIQTLEQYLQDWHDQVPKKHRKFVSDVAMKFEIALKAKDND